MDAQLQALDQIKATGIDLAMRFGPKLFIAVLILIAGYIVGRWTGNAIARALQRFQLERPVRLLIERIVRVTVLGLFGIMALQNLGVELLPLIAGLGVAGAGLALATQGVLSNMVAGLTIIFTQPFRVGDYVSIAKEEGEVLDISLSSTTLGHPDLSRVVIPNRKIVGEILHNYGKIRQLGVAVGVSYATDLGGAVDAIRAVLEANPRVLKDPQPWISIARLADSSVSIGVGPWVNVCDFNVATSEVNQAIVETFRGRRIAIALPRHEVQLLETQTELNRTASIRRS